MGKWSNLAFVLLVGAAAVQLGLQADYDGDGMSAAEELRGSSHAFVADSDNDGIRDDRELELNTSVYKQDTDGDGLIDGVEVEPPKHLAEADPLQKDVFLEVDHGRGVEPPREEIEAVERSFEQAPVKNPDGTEGIDVHVVYDGSFKTNESTVTVNEYFELYHDETLFQNKAKGYYHMVIVDNVSSETSGGTLVGGTLAGEDGVVVQRTAAPNSTGATAMHELGHAVGLSATDFSGIDSQLYSEQAYPSVMNYNYRADCSGAVDNVGNETCPSAYEFSGEQGAFNDWRHIETQFDGPETRAVDSVARQ